MVNTRVIRWRAPDLPAVALGGAAAAFGWAYLRRSEDGQGLGVL